MPEMRNVGYSAFQTDELHRHNQNLVGTLHATSLPWSTDMKTAVKVNCPKNSQCTNNE